MYHKLRIPETCIELWQECQSLVGELLKGCAAKTSGIIIDSSSIFDPDPASIYLITDGDISETYDSQLIVIHEKGDLLNADALAYPKLTRYETDFSATVDEYDGAAFINGITADKNKFLTWNKYLSCLLQSYQILMSHFSQQDTSSLPEFRQYNSGDVIIEEGTEGNEVFTLLSGAAKVMSEGKEVGIIKRDEIFGAIAALTNTPRTATIVATTDCDTLVANSENFQSILLTRPDVVYKLIEDMARTIVSSNQRIIELSEENG